MAGRRIPRLPADNGIELSRGDGSLHNNQDTSLDLAALDQRLGDSCPLPRTRGERGVYVITAPADAARL
jgi:hypothetical protein